MKNLLGKKLGCCLVIPIILLGYVLPQSVQSQDIVFPRIAPSEKLNDREFQTVKNIVRRAELYRGNEHENFFYIMKVTDLKDKKVQTVTDIKVNVNQDSKNGTRNSLIFIESGNSKGNRILQKEVNMWFYKPGTTNTLRISPAQRFIGGASYADISATNYSLYYDPISMEKVKIGKTSAYKLHLIKIKEGISYDTLIFYIATENNRPIKSEFYTRSGKLMKSMYFRNFVPVKKFGILTTEWVIVDNLNTKNVTNIVIKQVGFETLSQSRYTPDGLK